MKKFFRSERRVDPSWQEVAGQVVSLGGRIGLLDAVSSQGASVLITFLFAAGEPLSLTLPSGKKVTATVIESADGNTRLLFDYPIEKPL